VVGGQLDTFSMLVGATAGLGALGIAGAIAAAAAA